jgi:glycosyltransferase involved in cell wall biosynthesis
LLAQAHFLVQPSFESYGFAFCEASAYGLPSLGLRIGGVPIVEGVNGHALPAGSTAQDFTRLIKTYLDAPDDYARLRETARTEFEEHLNWDAWGRRVKARLRDFNTPSP